MTAHDPLYKRVATQLRAAILAGSFPVGALLPTEHALMTQFRISRHTARAALEILRDDGLVARQRGIGTRVASLPQQTSYTQSLNGLADLLQYARDTRLDIESLCAASRAECVAFGASTEQAWRVIAGVRRAGRLAVAATKILVRADLCPTRAAIRTIEGALNEWIAAHKGVRPARIEQEITACTLSPTEAGRLAAQAGAPALVTLRRYYDADGGIFQASLSRHPADRFTYRMRLDRD